MNFLYFLASLTHFSQGISGLVSQPLYYYMRETLGLSVPRIMYLTSLVTIPWMLKPVYGFFSDLFVIGSYKRKPYIILSALICSVMAFTIGFSPILSLPLLIVFLFGFSVGQAGDNVAINGFVVEEGNKTNTIGKLQCFDEQTEILTNHGWKRYNTISYEDQVLSLDNNTNVADYYPVSKIFVDKYDGELYQVKNHRMEFYFTPEHRFLYRPDGNSNFNISSMQEVKQQNWKHSLLLKNTFIWKKPSRSRPIIFKISDRNTHKIRKVVIPFDLWLSFLGWFISEGALFVNRTDYQFSISQVKVHNVKIIEKLLTDMGLNFWHNPTELMLCSKAIFRHLSKHCYTDPKIKKSFTKKIPNYLKNLSSRQIKIFLKSYNSGDGWIRKTGSEIGYATVSKQLADDIQELILKTGVGASIRLLPSKSMQINKLSKVYIGRPIYLIHGHFRKYKSIKNSDITLSPYSGIVWDVETKPHHLVLIRRGNGPAIWTGNSLQWGSLAVAEVLTGVLGGYLSTKYSYHISYLLIAIFPATIAIAAFFLNEQKAVKTTNKLTGIKEFFISLKNKQLLLASLFLFLFWFSPSIGTPLMDRMRNIGLSKMFIGWIGTIGSIFSIIGAAIYFKVSTKIDMKKWLYYSVIFSTVATFAYLYTTKESLMVYDVIFSISGQFVQLLMLGLMARTCPKGTEATVFALLTSIINFGGSMSNVVGAKLFSLFGYNGLVIISGIATFLCLFFIPFLEIEEK